MFYFYHDCNVSIVTNIKKQYCFLAYLYICMWFYYISTFLVNIYY